MKFAVLIPVGPGAKELERSADFFESLFRYERPEQIAVVVINDGNVAADLAAQLRKYSAASPTILENPRHGRGNGWSDGLCAAVSTGLRHICDQVPDASFVLKVDTDSLIIAPFSEQITRFFDERPEVGLIGSHLHEPAGGKPTESIKHWGKAVRSLCWPVSLSRRGGLHLLGSVWGNGRKLRGIIKAARRQGYVYGESCIGGGYALSKLAVKCLKTAGLVDDPLLSLHRGIGEDILMGAFIRSAGLKLADFNNVGEPFGVTFLGLYGALPELLQNGHSVIHSVKDHEGQREADVRAYFAAERSRHTSASLGYK